MVFETEWVRNNELPLVYSKTSKANYPLAQFTCKGKEQFFKKRSKMPDIVCLPELLQGDLALFLASTSGNRL